MKLKTNSEISNNAFVPEMNRLSNSYLNKIEKKLNHNSNENNYEKILNNLELLLEGQKVTQKDLQLGFIGLAKQNSELLDLNKELNQQLDVVMSELNQIKKEREEKATLKKKTGKQKTFA